jgi:hypothetical protein
MATLVEDLSRLNGTMSEGYKGIIGADMRSRVDILYQRATLLKQSAVRVVAEGGSLPVQLTATLRVHMSCVCNFYVRPVRYLTICEAALAIIWWAMKNVGCEERGKRAVMP